MFCSKCGAENYPSAKFCVDCGVKLTINEDKSSAYASPPPPPAKDIFYSEEHSDTTIFTKIKSHIKLICIVLAVIIGLTACIFFAINLVNKSNIWTPETELGSGSGDDKSTTLGEGNALKSAKSYLNVMSFSYLGLISQLESTGYTNSEAKYGADNCGADWNEQAAKQYLNTMAFSRERLIQQLEYVKFTHEQAVYGVEANGY